MKIIVFTLLFYGSHDALCKDYYEKNAIDKAHQKFSNQILSLSNSIDEFFADTKHEKNENHSKLKISIDTHFREAAGPYIIPDINYRLILPKSQKKLQLFIENDNEAQKSNTDQAKNDLKIKNKTREESDINAGLRYMIKKSGIDFSADTGVLVNIPIVVFAKFTAKKNIPLRNWLLKINEQVKWVNDNGFTSDFNFDYDRNLSRNLLLRMANNVFWNDEDYVIRFENGPSLFQHINRLSALSYHAHVVTINSPSFEVNNYILQMTYRRRLYGKWLFMEMSPFLNFPRSENFHRTPGFVLGLDAIFGHL